MKTKIKRFSRRTVSMVLVLLMMFSVLGIGSLITVNAANIHRLLTGDNNNKNNWGTGDYYMHDSVFGWNSGSSKCFKDGNYYWATYYLKYSEADKVYFRFYDADSNGDVAPKSGSDQDATSYNSVGWYGSGAFYVDQTSGSTKYQRVMAAFQRNGYDNYGYVWAEHYVMDDIGVSLAVDNASVVKGTEVTLTASASGDFSSSYRNNGDGGRDIRYTYQYSTDNGSTWSNIGANEEKTSTTDTYKWTPDPGTYKLKVYVNDDGIITSGDYKNAITGDRYAVSSTIDLVVKDTYAVTYDKGTNSASISGDLPANQTKIEDTALTLQTNSMTRRGFTANGWNTDSSGSGGTAYASGASYTSNAALTLYPAWTAWTYPWISSMSTADNTIDVGKYTTITTNVENFASISGSVTYNVYTDASGNTAADATGYALSDNSDGATSTVKFTGKKPGTYYVVATVTDGTNTDTYTTRVSVGVETPVFTRANMADLAVNSETAIAPSVSGHAPNYYYFEYSLDNSTFGTEITGTYFDISQGKIITKQPTTSAQTVYYRMKAGSDAGHITYTSSSSSFTVSVAEPTFTYSYPNPSAKYILLEDTGEKAALSGLSAFGLKASDVTWSIPTSTPASLAYEGVLSVHSESGALTPLGEGTATIRASVKFNDSYTNTYDLTGVTVQAATLSVNKTELTAAYGTENKALDYDNESRASFVVTTNAKDTAYSDITTVTVEKANERSPFTLDKNTISSTATEADRTVTITATGVTSEPAKIYVRYFIGDTEVESLRKTVMVNIKEYEQFLTIYFQTDSSSDFKTGGAYPYTWYTDASDGKDKDGKFIVPYGGSAGDGMVKIGTVDDKFVYAQKYYKKDVVGALGGEARKMLINSRHGEWEIPDTDNKTAQTADITPTGDCFENYQYFTGGSWSSDKLSITQNNYGCLKPTKAELAVTDTALPNSTTYNTTLTYTIEASGYTGTGANALVGYYTIADAPDNVTLSPNQTKGNITSITATATTTAGTDTFSGYLYFQNNNVLKIPEQTEAARTFNALAYESKAITVTDVDSTVHLRPVKLDGNSYSTFSGTGINASGTLSGASYSNRTVDGDNDLGENITISTGDVAGYTFVGYYKTTTEEDPLPTDTVPTVTTSSYTFKTNEIQNNAGTITSNYYVYAIYRRNLTISASKSYEYNPDHSYSTTYLAAPPKTITITRDGTVVATYTFDNSAEETSALTSEAGTFGDGTEIPLSSASFNVVAGDVVTMTYSMLAASDKITNVYYHNDYKPLANAENYYTNRNTLTGATIDQKDHSVSFTVADTTKNITIELGTKHRITFKSDEGFKTSDMNIGGYYADGEAIAFGVEKSSLSTKTYTLGTPVFYTTDGKLIVHELPNSLPAGKSASDYYVDRTFTLNYSADTGKFTGVMPAYDVVIDMNVTTQYRMSFKTKILSDVVNTKTEFVTTTVISAANKVTATCGETNLITTAATDSNGPSNTSGTLVDKGVDCVYSAELQAGYTFLGWYKGTESAPDLDNGLISESTTFSFVPKANTNVWAVATRDFFVAGNFTYDENTKALTHTSNKATDNNSNNWTAANKYYRMEYDFDEDAYAITFNSSNVTNTAKTDGNAYNPGEPLSDANFDYIYLFKCYATQGTGSAAGTETYWNNVKKYDGNWMEYEQRYGNDHMFFGKCGGDGGSGMFDFTQKMINDGYGAPVTLYFKPSASSNGSKWYVKSTRVWPDIYISDGYDNVSGFTNDTTTNVSMKVSGSYTPLSSTNNTDTTTHKVTDFGTSVAGAEKQVRKYNFKQNNAQIKLSKTVGTDYSVDFVVYDLTDDRVYPLETTKVGNTDEYTAELTVNFNKLYIVPVISYNGSDAMTIYVDSKQLNTDEWGDLVACYPWYDVKVGDEYIPVSGMYPGQLMVPSDDATSWTVKFKPTRDGGGELEGITFSNYYSHSNPTYSWLGRSVIGSGNIIETYNYVERSSNPEYNQSNCQVQTYDYREPFAYYKANTTQGVETMLSFSLKNGNNDVMKYYHDNLVGNGVNIFTGIAHTDSEGHSYTAADGKYKLSPSSFEMLTNSTGAKYTDLNGAAVSGEPTPSFYIIAKGQAQYTNSSLDSVNRSGNNAVTPTVSVTYDISGVSMEYGVQWYVYDASGNFIDTVSSAGYADASLSDSSMTVVAKHLTDKGYAVDGKSVAISYDFPRYYSNDHVYRFCGQWYATKNIDPVTVTGRVGIFVNGGYELSESNNENYGKAEVFYDYDKGNSAFYDSETFSTDTKKRDYVTTGIGDAKNSPIYLNASASNFVGWYYMNSSDQLVKATFTSNELFYPSFSGNVTYYAMYEVKANYTFLYLDRNGNKSQYVVEHNLKPEEIKGYSGNGNKPNIPTYIWTAEASTLYGSDPYTAALNQVNSVVSAYQYGNFAWPTVDSEGVITKQGDASITPNSSMMSLEVTANCPKATYTVNIQSVGDAPTRSASISVPAGNVLTFDPNYSFSDRDTATICSTFSTANVKYWSLDSAGAKPLTSVANFGLIINHNMTIYAQCANNIPAGASWNPLIESLSKTRTKTASTDTLYLDFNSYFVNRNGTMIHDMATTPHYGIILAYDYTNNTDGDYVDIGNGGLLTTANLESVINYFVNNPATKVAKKTINGRTIIFTCYDYNDNKHVSNRNRTNFSITGNQSMLNTKKLSTYTYIKDGDSISLSTTQFREGNNNKANQFLVSDFTDGSTTVFHN
ncbi:MAG: InlB B-repeat-containing protein [Ruminococcus sp.]|nr:InlB B-repeat-containing protein [Ruminococcus sp.]